MGAEHFLIYSTVLKKSLPQNVVFDAFIIFYERHCTSTSDRYIILGLVDVPLRLCDYIPELILKRK
jgi:hypothetical protein